MLIFRSLLSHRNTLNNNGAHGNVAKRKSLLSKESISAHHMDKSEGYWKNALYAYIHILNQSEKSSV